MINDGSAVLFDVYISNSNGSVTFGGSNEIVIDDDLRFGANDVNWINNGETYIGNDVEPNDLRGTIDNYGTITIVDDIAILQANEVYYYNHAGSYSYWGNDGGELGDLMLYANYDSNLVSYNKVTAQTLLIPQDAYWNLSISENGTKTRNSES